MSSQLEQISEGFYNLLMQKEQELYEDRIAICKTCKIMKNDNVFGPICNSGLYLNPITDEVSYIPREGFNHGCGCVLSAKARVKEATCPNRK
jgi:hypothetical protein